MEIQVIEPGPRPSNVWKGISESKLILQKGLTHFVGMGSKLSSGSRDGRQDAHAGTHARATENDSGLLGAGLGLEVGRLCQSNSGGGTCSNRSIPSLSQHSDT